MGANAPGGVQPRQQQELGVTKVLLMMGEASADRRPG